MQIAENKKLANQTGFGGPNAGYVNLRFKIDFSTRQVERLRGREAERQAIGEERGVTGGGGWGDRGRK